MAMDFVMGEQVPKKIPDLHGFILDVCGRTRNGNQSMYLIPDSLLGNFLQQLS